MRKVSWLAFLLAAVFLLLPAAYGSDMGVGGFTRFLLTETAESAEAAGTQENTENEIMTEDVETAGKQEDTEQAEMAEDTPGAGGTEQAEGTAAAGGEGRYTTSRVNFRDQPGVGEDSKVLTVLEQGTQVWLLEEVAEWSRCSLQEGTTGYIKSEYLSKDAPPPLPDSIICLTFDDGPSSDVTPRILDILKEYDVKATFFIVNYDESKIPILKRMLEEGHTIGIHTWSHDYDVCYATMDSYYEGVLKMAEKIQEDLNYEPFCIRFPGGSSNTVSRKYTPGVMTYLAELMPSEGYQYYDWNADSTDAEGNNRPADTLYTKSIGGFQKNRTNILLCHDLNSKSTTADMLPRLIEYGKENGYRFEPITRDTTPVHHGINN